MASYGPDRAPPDSLYGFSCLLDHELCPAIGVCAWKPIENVACDGWRTWRNFETLESWSSFVSLSFGQPNGLDSSIGSSHGLKQEASQMTKFFCNTSCQVLLEVSITGLTKNENRVPWCIDMQWKVACKPWPKKRTPNACERICCKD